jgi:hypothetical protein
MNVLFLVSLCKNVADEELNSSIRAVKSKESEETTTNLALQKENDYLRQRIIELEDMGTILKQGRRELGFENILLDSISELQLDDVPTMPIATDISLKITGSLEDSIGATTRQTVYMDDTTRLRDIYYGTKDLLPLLKVIYGNLSAPYLSEECTISGFLTKKTVRGSKWNRRFAILKDNFVIFYKDPKDDEPTSVERLDDCMTRIPDTTAVKFEGPILAIEVCSKVNPHYFYISSDYDTLIMWRIAINKTSGWWVSRGQE